MFRRIPAWAWITALVVVNLCLKCSWPGVNELAGDEPFTVYWALRPWAELFAMLRTENNPPLYFALMHGWVRVVPLEEGLLRIPSALFSAFTVWPLFLLGKRFGGIRTALLAALLFTFSNHHFGFAHEVRAYSLLTLLTTVSFWQFQRLADGAPRARTWSILISIALIYTHFFGWLVIGLQLLLTALVPMYRIRWKAWATVLGATVAAALPYGAILVQRMGSSLASGTWLETPGWDEPYNMIWRWSNAPVVAVLLLLCIVLSIFLTERKPNSALLWAWCFMPLVGMFLFSFIVPVYLDRYLLFASPAFHLLCAQSMVLLAERSFRRPIAAYAGAALMLGTFTPWKNNGLHPSQVVRAVEEQRTSRTAVLIQPAWYGLTYAWHLDPALFRTASVEEALLHNGIHLLSGPRPLPIDPSMNAVIYVDAWDELTDPGQFVTTALKAEWTCGEPAVHDRNVKVQRCVRPAP